MKVHIATIGRMKAGPERELAARYFDRFAKSAAALGLDLQKLVEYPEARAGTIDERRREEAAHLARSVPEGGRVVVLDETGKLLSSEEFADVLASSRDGGARDVSLIIGGPDGHDRGLLARADLVLSLGRMTFPHQLARVLLAEQLYRAATILAGHPYHRR